MNSLARPITPQATLGPELPFILDYPSFLPRSSSFLCTTTDRPIIEYSPNNDNLSSLKHMLELPEASEIRLPKSPRCLSYSNGPPCCLLKGL